MEKEDGEGSGIVFTVPIGSNFLGLGEHEPLIIGLFLPIVLRRKWKGPWTIQGSDWGHRTFRALEIECKQEWEQPGPIPMEGNLQQVLKEGSERCGIFCGNFYVGRGQYPPCQRVWCGVCYVKQPKDDFPKSGKESRGDRKGELEGR